MLDRAYILNSSRKLAAMSRVMHLFKQQDSRNMEQNMFGDRVTPSLFQNINATSFGRKSGTPFYLKKETHMII